MPRGKPRPGDRRRSSPPPKRSSVVAGAAVDVNRLTGDEAAIVADEKQAGGGGLVDGALAAQRDARGVRSAFGIPFRIVAPRVDAARRDDIDPDIMGRKLRGEAAR